MRRIIMLITAIVLILGLSVSAGAVTQATMVRSQASVLIDESCEVVVTATFHLDTPMDDLTFPLPVDAANVTLNGARVGTAISGEARHVDISRITGGMAGDFSVVISYRLKDVIDFNDEGILQATIPLLSGFSYPVDGLELTVTMPEAVTEKPAFSSGYHKSNIEQYLQFSVDGAVITASSTESLKDHETLDMTVSVSEELFPQRVIELQNLDGFYLAMGIAAAVALIYWLIFLRNLPPRFITSATAPEGFSAGQMGSVLNLRGADLTMMVFSWAQLGYLVIHTDKKGRVTLQKQMEMGNERSAFEQRCFKNLFGNRNTVDTSGSRYAEMCRKTGKMPPNIQGLVHPKSGSAYVFRSLMAIVGMLCGICLGLTLSAEAAVRWFPAVLMALFCGIGSWLLHNWWESIFTHRRGSLLAAVVVITLWVVLSIVAKTFWLDGWVIFGQLLVGLMAAFGGRRTEAGRQAMSEVLGLRRYLRRLPRKQLEHIYRQNPDYFHMLIPYALALGVDKGFAKHFDREPMPDCPYMTGVAVGRMRAVQWSRVMRRTIGAMEAKSRTKPLDDLMARLQSFIK
ncbi:MAG: DUF2207 domain-containing protein [Oscillospiraceae bacterium]|nr:DUF2207 domain-containing protein [Oscillospiraceae bacterium]